MLVVVYIEVCILVVCMPYTTTHTDALKLTKLYSEPTLRILRQVCMEEQVV